MSENLNELELDENDLSSVSGGAYKPTSVEKSGDGGSIITFKDNAPIDAQFIKNAKKVLKEAGAIDIRKAIKIWGNAVDSTGRGGEFRLYVNGSNVRVLESTSSSPFEW